VSDNDKNKTLLGMRAISEGKEPTEEQKLALENHARFMIAFRHFIEHMVNYWKRWILFLLGSLIGGFSFRDTIETLFK